MITKQNKNKEGVKYKNPTVGNFRDPNSLVEIRVEDGIFPESKTEQKVYID